ncbi:MFS transporter [Duganella sp. sic0402]|uniref:MFS transporter n=1 Tax=Duganella sp. sic0402 TaxID=2854786 RepID=UPI001C4969CD|nr:MFS transporter [Duganella sp. sic0402]MBV7537710.1 MFS transporter [Duganella sp. sic0402]
MNALPIGALLALATTGFLALLTEIIPAGTISLISAGMGVSESVAGQFITLYAAGALVAAIPMTAATITWRRKPLLLCTLAILLLANALTAITDNLYLVLAVRFLAGVAGAMIWGMLAGYARRMVPDHLKGRALAIAGVGTPLALSIGVPLGSWLGGLFGWRFAFVALAVLTLVAIIWIALMVPDYPGQQSGSRSSLTRVLRISGVRQVLTVLVGWVLAHSILYTFVVPFLATAGMAEQSETVLLAFGLASLAGIWVAGALIDGHLRRLVLLSLLGFAVAALVLGVAANSAPAVYCAVLLWGLTFGGSPALLQTASADAAGEHADVAQAMLVTCWNSAIAIGGIIGGVLLDTLGAQSFPWALLVLLIPAILLAWRSQQHGFPPSGVLI